MTRKTQVEFDLVDPYNPGNTVSGIIYRTNEKYGSLLIRKVNGRECEQYIFATPKFYYPGGVLSPRQYKEGNFPSFNKVTAYEKIDGTNVYMFRYKDADGNVFTSFKTRLVPFLKADGFKNWVLMWAKMTDKYAKEIGVLIDKKEYGFAFEMFGSANKILVDYKVPLDTRLIYAIDAKGNIIPPDGFGFPIPGVVSSFNSETNPDDKYKDLVQKYEEWFVAGKEVEGCVMYVQKEDGTCVAWKCKPPSVLSLQCEGNSLVGYNDAYTTAMNAMESCTVDTLESETYDLLAEVYEETKIELSKEVIDRAISDAKKYIIFRQDVVKRFKNLGLKWNGITMKSSKPQKDVVMRPMMQNSRGMNAAEVFNALLDHFTIFGE